MKISTTGGWIKSVIGASLGVGWVGWVRGVGMGLVGGRKERKVIEIGACGMGWGGGECGGGGR